MTIVNVQSIITVSPEVSSAIMTVARRGCTWRWQIAPSRDGVELVGPAQRREFASFHAALDAALSEQAETIRVQVMLEDLAERLEELAGR